MVYSWVLNCTKFELDAPLFTRYLWARCNKNRKKKKHTSTLCCEFTAILNIDQQGVCESVRECLSIHALQSSPHTQSGSSQVVRLNTADVLDELLCSVWFSQHCVQNKPGQQDHKLPQRLSAPAAKEREAKNNTHTHTFITSVSRTASRKRLFSVTSSGVTLSDTPVDLS